jgi:ATP adenylyltransferase/5',5'''-P-1,P-4-tetraphosphate phosphorylase II
MDQFSYLLDTNKSAAQLLSEFAEAQKLNWPLAMANYEGLKSVENKTFTFDGFQVKVQFNPERMRSSAAKVDKTSIAERQCFLCNENRPQEQKAIAFGEEFLILVNPFPIFKTHLTISSNTHIPQRFLANAPALLDLAAAMEGFTVLYNGPESGASAPDHLHFQAGESDFLPLSSEFERLKAHTGQLLFSGFHTRVWAFGNYLRKMISIQTDSITEGLGAIELFIQKFSELQPEKVEPMVNVLCSWNKGKWTIHLFPRKAHRPTQFFASGNDQLLISPGSVDLGGVFVTPRKEDFDKISQADIINIMEQVSINQNIFTILVDEIKIKMKGNSNRFFTIS